jgi:transposase
MMWMADCRVFLCTSFVDMRKSYEGLAALTQSVLRADPLSGHVFVFFNAKLNRLKMLYWHLNGFCITQKRLEKGQFHLPSQHSKDHEEGFPMTYYQLSGLFQGIEWEKIPSPKVLSYQQV